MNLFQFFLTSLLLGITGLTAAETVLDTAPVPNRLLRQGEARWILRENAVGVTIDLHTRYVKRVRKKILATEKKNWPGNPASRLYCEALDSVTKTLLSTRDGKIPFRIEWFLSADGKGRVFIGNDQHHKVMENLPATYLRKNLLLILQDRFGLSADEARAELERHLP